MLVSTSEWVTEDAQPPCCGWQALGDELDPLKETLKTAEGNQDAAGVADARQKIHEVNTKHGLHISVGRGESGRSNPPAPLNPNYIKTPTCISS